MGPPSTSPPTASPPNLLVRLLWLIAIASAVAGPMRQFRPMVSDSAYRWLLVGSWTLALAASWLRALAAYAMTDPAQRGATHGWALRLAVLTTGAALVLGELLHALLAAHMPAWGTVWPYDLALFVAFLVPVVLGWLLTLALAGIGLRGAEAERGPARRSAWICGAALVLIAGAAWHLKEQRTEAIRRACHFQQRKILGALEMYSLDKNIPPAELPWSAEMVEALYADGYFDGGDEYCIGTESNGGWAYFRREGSGLTCLHHGTEKAPAPLRWWRSRIPLPPRTPVPQYTRRPQDSGGYHRAETMQASARDYALPE